MISDRQCKVYGAAVVAFSGSRLHISNLTEFRPSKLELNREPCLMTRR